MNDQKTSNPHAVALAQIRTEKRSEASRENGRRHRLKVPPKRRETICRMYDLCGYTMRSLAKTFGLSTPTVRAIVRGSYGKKEAAK